MLATVVALAVSALPFVDAIERGQPARALSLAIDAIAELEPGTSERATAHLTVISALAELRRGAELTDALDRSAEDGIELGSFGAQLGIEAAARANACSSAAASAGQLSLHSVFQPFAWARVAQCAVRTHDESIAESAIQAYADAADSDWQNAEASLLRGRWLEACGELADAGEVFHEIRVRYPFTQAASIAAIRLKELAARGVRAGSPRGAELFPRARALRDQLRKRASRRTYLSILRSTKKKIEVRLRALTELAELEIVDYRYVRALTRLEEVVRESQDPTLRARALYLQGDVHSRRGRLEAALEAFDRAVQEHPQQGHALEAALAAARLAYSKRLLDRAEAWARWLFEHEGMSADDAEIITEDGARREAATQAGRHRDEAAWLLAWIGRRRGDDHAQMDTWLARISGEHPVGLAARYWRARLAVERGDLVSASQRLVALESIAATHFYTSATRTLLCEAGGPCPVSSSASVTTRPGVDAEDLAGIVLIFDHGLRNTAHRFLKNLPYRALGPADRAHFAWIHDRSGELSTSTRVSRSLTGELLDDHAVRRAAYPMAFDEVVSREARRSGVPAALLLAVIREESGFDPTALSPRGARGLMQMIPRTARRMARSAELDRFRLSMLYRPEISIRLGAHYLSLLLDQFDGELAPAIASYHAGEKTVSRWKKSLSDLDEDEFIEEIPYSSTRGYVKKVLGTYRNYAALYRL